VAVGVGQRPYPDGKILLLPAVVLGGKLPAALDKMVRIGVVTVVLAAFFSYFLEQ
jgi:hypothetical protein